MEQAARFEQVRIQLPEPLDGVESLSAVLGIPEWWPSGERIGVAIAHGAGSDLDDPLIEAIQRHLTARKYLTLRFNFPFVEAGRDADRQNPEGLDRAFRAALSILGRDPVAAPARLFIGGMGLGATVAAQLATERLQIDGAFFLGFPLHPEDEPEQVNVEHLFRIVPAMLFVQGSEDPRCRLDALRQVLSRVGAPTTLRIVDGADESLQKPGSSEADRAAHERAITEELIRWFQKVLGNP